MKKILNDIKAVLFDLDGTLIDSMWMWQSIDEEYLAKFGIIQLPDDLQRTIEGMSFTETAMYFKKTFNIPYSLEDIKAEWNNMAYEKYKTQVTLKKGVLEFLKYLKENNIKTGIATSNSKELVEVAINGLGILKYFDSIRTACEVERGKPAPDIYLLVAKDLNVNPENCLVFEDVPMGILAGKNANMRTCAIKDEYSKHLIEEKIRLADFYIEDYTEILK